MKSAVCLAGVLLLSCVGTSLAQSPFDGTWKTDQSKNKLPASDAQPAAGTAPVAFVYVSSTPSGTTNKVSAFTAAANGKLTPVPGSPFADNITSMAVNGKYLFGSTKSGIYVSAYSIQSSGALRLMTSTNIAQYNTSGCFNPYSPPLFGNPLVLDHTGLTLNLSTDVGSTCDSGEHQSFSINNATGALHFLGSASPIFLWDDPLSFRANNAFAYGTECINYQGGYLDTFSIYQRGTNGLLSLTGINAPTPPAKSGDFYCRSFTAADPTNHLAVSVQAINQYASSPDGPPQLAIYTGDNFGNLTTTSTAANMPATAVGDVSALRMSPTGNLLAVAGQGGLQIFHVNAGSPITPYTGLLTTDDIEQCFWDNANHLYAISRNKGRLRVFTITPTTHSEATGSPYSITSPSNIIVQPK